MKLSLTVLIPEKLAGQTISIPTSRFLIGRDPQCQLRPSSPLVSNRHCALLIKNGRVFLRDFASTNGTFINNEKVNGIQVLQNEDLLKVGPLEFRVKIESTPINKPTPVPPRLASFEDDVAAMLLALPDDSPSPGPITPPEIPSGSTVMDVPSPVSETADQSGPKKPEPNKEGENKEAGNTSQAAKILLEKYMRRPRS